MDLPIVGDDEDSVMIVEDHATKMVHLIPCKKTTIASEATRLHWQPMFKLHGIP